AEIEFVIIGGAAAIAHGSARLTEDLDIVYRRTSENIERLVQALAPYKPYLRGAPPGLPFKLDQATMQRGLNFTLTTSLGDIDLLGEIAGGGNYENLVTNSVSLKLFGTECRCINLEQLIHSKRAAGRPKDIESIAELESLLVERQS
ncbi:MAG: nucleotidyl transferase AbiEii/AbiGii toxin family protein, partial [Acidobacteriota bacterium]